MYDTHKIILKKFEFPNSVIKEYEHWYWLLRPEQITLGSSIIIVKEYCPALSSLQEEKFSELFYIYKEVEKTLKNLFDFDKINYLMLMMKDPTLHYHVIPRYKNEKDFKGVSFFDISYPSPPDFKYSNNYSVATFDDIRNFIMGKI
tara:strand:- start:1150 stop:1587 length:438 start_codon:yes stop_codon:yes gene_type:complete